MVWSASCLLALLTTSKVLFACSCVHLSAKRNATRSFPAVTPGPGPSTHMSAGHRAHNTCCTFRIVHVLGPPHLVSCMQLRTSLWDRLYNATLCEAKLTNRFSWCSKEHSIQLPAADLRTMPTWMHQERQLPVSAPDLLRRRLVMNAQLLEGVQLKSRQYSNHLIVTVTAFHLRIELLLVRNSSTEIPPLNLYVISSKKNHQSESGDRHHAMRSAACSRHPNQPDTVPVSDS